MRARILVLTALHALAVVGLAAAGRGAAHTPWDVPATLLFAAGYALAGLATTHLELRRHAFSVSAQEGVLVAALLVLRPEAVVVAVGVGELAACLRDRLGTLKVAFNVAQTMSATAVAAGIMAAGGHTDPSQRATWVWVSLAVGAFFVVNVVSVAGIVALAEGRPLHQVLLATAGPALVTTSASGSLGLLVVVLRHDDGMAPLLMLPVLAVLLLASAGLAAQRSERMRFERLYQSSSRTSELMAFDDVLATLAEEARSLVTGSAAMCCALLRDGTWAGALATDEGRGPADQAAVDAVVAVSQVHGTAHIRAGTLAPAIRERLPRGATLVVTEASAATDTRVVLAVFRELGSDEQGVQRADVLGAFGAHAALAVANAQLFAEVEDALQHQIDLNRQKGEFVASVSHELRTPLTGVLTSVATMRRLDHSLSPEQRGRLFEVAQASGERLRRLIDELLLVASAEHGGTSLTLRPVEVAEVVDGVAVELAKPSEGRLRVEVAEGTGSIVTDVEKFRRIVTNLAENAVKYAPEGPIEVRAEPAGDGVVLTVRDHGPGIPPADRDRIFERFVQLDQSSTRRAGGTGLGLYLSRQLAVALGGSLEVTDAPGGGACFILTVPRSVAEADEDERPTAADASGPEDGPAQLDADYVTGGVA